MTAIVNTVNSESVNEHQPEQAQLDQFGRDAQERTVELSSEHAEAIDQEVEHGKHATYGDALAYVIQRGFAEIKRTRESARKLALKTLRSDKVERYADLMKTNPALIANAEFVATMMKDLAQDK